MNKIIIVESPSKSHTIESYMGEEYKVLSSKGHIRDLATSGSGGLGIDINNGFKPIYVDLKEKKELIKELKKECKGKEVYLATDPDREGEAISWHLAQVLNLDLNQSNRVVFNEITKPAVLEAFKHPRKIDQNLVSSQETRRMLDRIIGFKLSNLLQQKIDSPSAGRVQSVALKLIVDLEKEINAFIPQEYYEIKAIFDDFEALLVKYKDEIIELGNEDEALKYLDMLTSDFLVSNVEQKETYRDPKPAYITSTLQQDASTKLNFNSAKTMRLAQALYEGKEVRNETLGLITYMRTDSDRLSNVFVNDAKEYILKTYGNDYLGSVQHRNVPKSQDAHEAIRPTSIYLTPNTVKNYLTPDEYKLYKMIYARTLASLMKKAKFKNSKIELNNNDLIFRATGSELVFDGFLKVYGEYQDVSDTVLPKLRLNETIKAKNIDKSQHFTKAPSRYTEAKLIKDMEELGIGRPSTYAQTIQTLKNRKYVDVKEKRIIPTERGIITTEKLGMFFGDIINVDYTANMENVLDSIAQGEKKWDKTISDFYQSFIPLVNNAKEKMDRKTGNICPICGGELVMKKGKYGSFEACSNYPNCTYIKKEEIIKTDVLCPKCKKGYFISRVASKGKNKGKVFFGCDNYPDCKNAVKGKPTGDYCKECGNVLIEYRGKIICGTPKCSYNLTKKD